MYHSLSMLRFLKLEYSYSLCLALKPDFQCHCSDIRATNRIILLNLSRDNVFISAYFQYYLLLHNDPEETRPLYVFLKIYHWHLCHSTEEKQIK